MAQQHQSSPLLDAALAYAARGWPVVALHTPVNGGCSCGKPDCDKPAKHPRWHKELLPHGLKDATTDPGVVRDFWRRWPYANIGIVTGRQSGLLTLDIDPKNGGIDGLRELMRRHGALTETLGVKTGGGGWHMLYAHPRDEALYRNVTNLDGLPGLDIRGDGGYIVAAPSLHVSGARYAWENTLEPAPPPDWLLELLRRSRSAPTLAPIITPMPEMSSENAAHWVKHYLNQAQEGNRNETGMYLARQLRDTSRLSLADAEPYMVAYADGVPGVGYSAAEALRTLHSIYTRPAGQPATLRNQPQPVTQVARKATQAEPEQESDGPEEPTPLRKFIFMRDTEVENLPPPSWLIDGHLVENTLSIVYGEYGSAKSFLTLDWALCVATGMHWNGCAVKQGVVAYVAGEGIGGMGNRIRAWKQQRGWQGESDLWLLGDPPQFLSNEDMGLLHAALRALPEPPKLVIIDTLARSLAGGDENSAQDMGKAVQNADIIAKLFGCHVLLVHHKPKNGAGTRGSSSLPGAAYSMIEVTKDEDLITVRCEKQKDAKEFETSHYRLKVIDLENLDDQTSCVLAPTAAPSKSGDASRPTPPSERAILACLANGSASFSAIVDYVDDKTGVGERGTAKALNRLVDRNAVEKVGGVYYLSDSELNR
jgi:hypothetical protein